MTDEAPAFFSWTHGAAWLPRDRVVCLAGPTQARASAKSVPAAVNDDPRRGDLTYIDRQGGLLWGHTVLRWGGGLVVSRRVTQEGIPFTPCHLEGAASGSPLEPYDPLTLAEEARESDAAVAAV